MDTWGALRRLHADGAGDHVIDIPAWKLGLIAALLALPITVAGTARLHVNRPLIVAGVRCFLQLLLLGGILRVIFANGSLLWVTMYIVFMMTVASIEAGSRPPMSYKGMHLHVGLSLVTPAFCALIYMLTIIIQPSPLYEPQYSIPLMGMMLGNSLTGVTVGVKTLLETMSTQRATVEWRLCMGATRWEAVSPMLRQVLRTALTPVINMLSVAGLVSIPGMLTGQILGGSSPVVAAKYQIMIMFAVATTTTAAVGTAILLAILQLTDAHHCLRLDRLESSNSHAGLVVWNIVVDTSHAVHAWISKCAAKCGLGPKPDLGHDGDDDCLLNDGPQNPV